MTFTAFDIALDLPRADRASPINVGQLRLLCTIAHKSDLTRHDLLDLETHDKPTVDKRLSYLVIQLLCQRTVRKHYHEASGYRATAIGIKLYRALLGSKAHSKLILALDKACALPVKKREDPINVGHLKVLQRVDQQPKISTSGLLPFFDNNKQTLRSRLQFLERKGLIDKFPKSNAGGNGNPNFYVATAQGRKLVRGLL